MTLKAIPSLAAAGLLLSTLAPAGAAAQGAAAQPPVTAPASGRGLDWGPCPPIFAKGCEIAVLHGDPAQPNADVFLRVPGGYGMPAHSHTSAERMVLVTGRLRVKYKGHPAATLEQGSYAYGPAALPHDAACVSREPCTLFIAFEGPVDALPFDGPVD